MIKAEGGFKTDVYSSKKKNWTGPLIRPSTECILHKYEFVTKCDTVVY